MKLFHFYFIIFITATSLLIYELYLRFRQPELPAINISKTIYSEPLGNPVGIAAPTINLWLPLIPSHFYKNNWETTTRGVSYWSEGIVPGKAGNAIIYAHNWTNLFGKLPNIKTGDYIEIYYSDNTKKIFVVKFTQEVQSDISSILKNTSDTRITLYTCSGFLDSLRFVVVATPSV